MRRHSQLRLETPDLRLSEEAQILGGQNEAKFYLFTAMDLDCGLILATPMLEGVHDIINALATLN